MPRESSSENETNKKERIEKTAFISLICSALITASAFIQRGFFDTDFYFDTESIIVSLFLFSFFFITETPLTVSRIFVLKQKPFFILLDIFKDFITFLFWIIFILGVYSIIKQ